MTVDCLIIIVGYVLVLLYYTHLYYRFISTIQYTCEFWIHCKKCKFNVKKLFIKVIMNNEKDW